MFSGIAIGYLIRKVKFLQKINKLIFFVIIMLLFLIGANIGTDKSIVDSFATIGTQAVVIAVFTTIGSLIGAWFIGKFIFKDSEK